MTLESKYKPGATADVPVLIVGAGPTGLVLALWLTRLGVAVRLIDKTAEPGTTSRALAVSARTLELYQQLGIAGPLVDGGVKVPAANFWVQGTKIVRLPLDRLGQGLTPFPFALIFPQDAHERVLIERLEALGVKVERRTSLVGFDQEPERVRATIERPDGSREICRAIYLAGCDGARSTVRETLATGFPGGTYSDIFFVADVDGSGPATNGEIHVDLGKSDFLAVFPLKESGRVRLVGTVIERSADQHGDLTFDDVRERVVGHLQFTIGRVNWFSNYHVHHRVAANFRHGRALLLGDAAHIHSPVGGQGMNTGIQDAYNLAWKLALVTRGAARESLLDSYEAERQPIAKALLDTTDAAMRGMEVAIGLRSPIATALRNQLISLVTSTSLLRTRMSRTVSMLDVSYPDSPIVKQDRIPVWQANVTSSTSTEKPSLADWAAFGDAPAPGHRAVDAPLDSVPGRRHVLDLLRGTRHVLFLFDGAAPTAAGYRNLQSIGTQVRERFGSWVDVHLVVPYAERPAELAWDGSLILDRSGAFHQRYGARSECLYLVRPDGYVAYRCQPASGDSLLAYLGTIFA